MANIGVRMHYREWLLVAAAVAFSPTNSLADQGSPGSSDSPPPHFWLTLGWISWHVDRDERKNWLNYGLGLEAEISERWVLSAGGYRNTFDEPSFYAGALWRFWRDDSLSAVVMLGVVNGYRHVNDRGLSPCVFPMIQWQGHRVGANLALVPPYDGKTNGLVALQLKFPF